MAPTHCRPAPDSVSLSLCITVHQYLNNFANLCFVGVCFGLLISVLFPEGSSNNLQYRTERIKIPSTPRYPRSVLGSDRGESPLRSMFFKTSATKLCIHIEKSVCVRNVKLMLSWQIHKRKECSHGICSCFLKPLDQI